jgi:hypothetical protein
MLNTALRGCHESRCTRYEESPSHQNFLGYRQGFEGMAARPNIASRGGESAAAAAKARLQLNPTTVTNIRMNAVRSTVLPGSRAWLQRSNKHRPLHHGNG